MIYRRRRRRSGVRSGFYRFENQQRKTVSGFGEGDFVTLRDEPGNMWRGQAEQTVDNSIRLFFRDPDGNLISGMSDDYGIVLRYEFGNTWRGFID